MHLVGAFCLCLSYHFRFYFRFRNENRSAWAVTPSLIHSFASVVVYKCLYVLVFYLVYFSCVLINFTMSHVSRSCSDWACRRHAVTTVLWSLVQQSVMPMLLLYWKNLLTQLTVTTLATFSSLCERTTECVCPFYLSNSSAATELRATRPHGHNLPALEHGWPVPHKKKTKNANGHKKGFY